MVLSMVPLTVGGAGVLCPQYLSQWEGTGVLCPRYLSHWEGAGVLWSQTQAPGPRRYSIWQCSILPGQPHSLPFPVSCLALPASTSGTFSKRPAYPLPL